MVVLHSQPSPRQAALKGVKWRFLAAPIEKGQLTEGQTPWTDEARRRIGFLERALASTHDLESQFTSFLSEVAQGDAARGPEIVAVCGHRRRVKRPLFRKSRVQLWKKKSKVRLICFTHF